MSLENEMKQEMLRLESEIAEIDTELQKLQVKVVNLLNIKKKKEHNLSVLKSNFSEYDDEKEIQTNLQQLLKKAE
jgi:hypothetical protein